VGAKIGNEINPCTPNSFASLSVQNLVETVGGEDPSGPLQQALLTGLPDPLPYSSGKTPNFRRS